MGSRDWGAGPSERASARHLARTRRLVAGPGGTEEGERERGGRGPLPGGFSGGNPLKNIKCTKCPEVFQGVEKLVFHMRAQHFIFMCPRCGKQFNHSSNLNRHMNVHRGVKSHSCGICGKCFTQKSTLHDHLNLHTGARPYRCSYCDVRFAHKPAIRRHLKEQHGKTTAENVLEASVAEINVLIR
ncbi:PREDICTED: zinc finger and BTB domain-containing protein 12 [Rhinopithecus bieti]|uniref:zinc finger and BTB domain-containing protein 12 n=1 Tax=Rhinopithecus bieti TaxID=61621 RepID=UPI00083C396A|nr:PREDICTED: zinc finger and BTB domain-containing protein 12 [Rhinopithecus bieti]